MSIHWSRISPDLVMWTADGPFEVDGVRYHGRGVDHCPRLAFQLTYDAADHDCGDYCDTELGLYDYRDQSCKESGLPSPRRSRVYRWQPGDPVYIGATR